MRRMDWFSVSAESWMTKVPSAVGSILARLENAGYQGYVVGGAVRDLAWGYPVSDWDLTTDAPLSVLLQWYPGPQPGARFGTVWAGGHVEITVLRAEQDYRDGRHPERVEPIRDITQDLRRRDFTVNALAFNTRQLIGCAPSAWRDLDERVWRAVGIPEERFAEDGLRIFRFVRFLMRYGGRADEATQSAARTALGRGINVSRERRLAELFKMMAVEYLDWSSYRTIGLDAGYERDGPSSPLPWKWPKSPDARLLLWLREGFADMSRASAWIARWPLRKSLRKQLLAAGSILWKEQSPEAWARYARLGVAGSNLLAELAKAQGYDGPVDAVRPVLATEQLYEQFQLRGVQLGQAAKFLQKIVADDPKNNRRRILEGQLQQWLRSAREP